MYGTNSDLDLGFGAWLSPFSDLGSAEIEKGFREDYETHAAQNRGKPTWMHLIREEVAEAFDAQTPDDMIMEAVQVAALYVSLVEHLLEKGASHDY